METVFTLKYLIIGVVNIGLLCLILKHYNHAYNNKEEEYKDLVIKDLDNIILLFMLLFLINSFTPDFTKNVIMYYKSLWEQIETININY